MEDIDNVTRTSSILTNVVYPETAIRDQRFDISFDIEYTGHFSDRIIVKVYNTISQRLLYNKVHRVGAGDRKSSVSVSSQMLNENKYYRIVLIDDNIWPIRDEIEDGKNIMVRYVVPTDDFELCKQKFMTSYGGKPVSASIKVSGTTIYTNPYGEIHLKKGESQFATAYYKTEKLSRNFRACTSTIIFDIPKPIVPTPPDAPPTEPPTIPPVIPPTEPPVTPPTDDDKEDNLLLYAAVFIGALAMFKGR